MAAATTTTRSGPALGDFSDALGAALGDSLPAPDSTYRDALSELDPSLGSLTRLSDIDAIQIACALEVSDLLYAMAHASDDEKADLVARYRARRASQRSVARSFRKRADAMVANVSLLIDHLPENQFRPEVVKDSFPILRRAIIDAARDLADKYERFCVDGLAFKTAFAQFKRFFDQICELIARNTTLDIKIIAKELEAAEAFVIWGQTRQDVESMAFIDGKRVVQHENYQIEMFSPEQIQEFKEFESKKWFQDLKPWQQQYLRAQLVYGDTVRDPRDVFHVGSIMTRDVPHLANHSLHTFSFHTGEFDLVSQRVRTGVVTCFDIEDQAEQDRATQQNIVHLVGSYYQRMFDKRHDIWGDIVDGLPILVNIQTLLFDKTLRRDSDEVTISSQGAAKAYPSLKKEVEIVDCKNRSIHALRTRTDITTKKLLDGRKVKIVLTGTNRPTNIGRYFNDWTRCKTTRAFTVKILQEVERFLRTIGVNGDKLPQLLKALQTLTADKIDAALFAQMASFITTEAIANIDDKPWNDEQKFRAKLLLQALRSFLQLWNDDKDPDRNFLLCGLEEIIIEHIGGVSTGSCKSGKDRKGVEVLLINALLIYFSRCGKLPGYTSLDQKFLDIFADLFLSTSHHELIAEFNAPGALGIQHLSFNIPKTYVEAIHRRAAVKLQALAKLFSEDVRRAILRLAQESAKVSLVPLAPREIETFIELDELESLVQSKGSPNDQRLLKELSPVIYRLCNNVKLSMRLAEISHMRSTAQDGDLKKIMRAVATRVRGDARVNRGFSVARAVADSRNGSFGRPSGSGTIRGAVTTSVAVTSAKVSHEVKKEKFNYLETTLKRRASNHQLHYKKTKACELTFGDQKNFDVKSVKNCKLQVNDYAQTVMDFYTNRDSTMRLIKVLKTLDATAFTIEEGAFEALPYQQRKEMQRFFDESQITLEIVVKDEYEQRLQGRPQTPITHNP